MSTLDCKSIIGNKYSIKNDISAFRNSLYQVENGENGSIEIVKVIDIKIFAEEAVKEVFKELKEVSTVNRNNLVYLNMINVVKEKLILKMLEYKNSLLLVNPGEYFEENGIFDLLMGICEGIKELNSVGYYHGNIKPSNIFLDEENKVKLSDYLLSKLYKGSETIRGETIDDLCYINVEELLNEEIDESVDIWSFGCIFYYLIKNENIFKSKSICETIRNIENCKFNKFRGEFSEEYNKMMKKIIVKDRTKRLKIDELINEIQNINQPQLPVTKVVAKEELDNDEEELESEIKLMIDKKVEEYKNRKSTELYLNCCSYEDGNKKVIQGTNIKMEDSGLLYLCDRIMEINNLQVLNISCNGISSVRINEFFRLLKNITELKILDISDNNKIEDSGIEVLSNCGITSKGMDSLSKSLSNVPELQCLSINGNNIKDGGMKVLSENLKSIPNLKSLSICGCGITDNGFRNIAVNLKNIPHLEVLSVGNNKIEDKSVNVLLENIQHIPELKKLYLNGNKTPTNKWKKQIASNHPNKELVVQI